MTFGQFLQLLSDRTQQNIHYNVYSAKPLETGMELDLNKQRNSQIMEKVTKIVENILEKITTELLQKYKLDFEDQLTIDLTDILQIIMKVRTQYQIILDITENATTDHERKQAIIKIRMINEDIFDKIPILAGEVFYQGS